MALLKEASWRDGVFCAVIRGEGQAMTPFQTLSKRVFLRGNRTLKPLFRSRLNRTYPLAPKSKTQSHKGSREGNLCYSFVRCQNRESAFVVRRKRNGPASAGPFGSIFRTITERVRVDWADFRGIEISASIQ